jgi:hypothetical protein
MTSEPDAPVERPEDDDYDLLTYGEAAARLDELLREERVTLAALKADPSATADQISGQERRIALLQDSDTRYREHAETADRFMQMFGLTPRKRD